MNRQIVHFAIYILLILIFSCSRKDPDKNYHYLQKTINKNYPCLQVLTNWENSNYVLPYPKQKNQSMTKNN
jgi:hypothetical protein